MLDPRELASRTNHILYVIRLSILEEISSLPRAEVEAYMTTNERYYKRGFLSVYGELREILGQATAIANTSFNIPVIIHGDDYEDLTIRGRNLHFNDVRGAARNALSKCRELLGQLTFGMELPFDLNNIVDDMSCRTPGYSLGLGTTVEERKKSSRALLVVLLSNPEIRSRFLDEENNWNREEMSLYLNLYSEYIDSLFLLIHLTSGQPARGTEIATLTIANGPTGHRSVMWYKGRMLLLCHYSKLSSQANNSRAVARFLDASGSKVLLLDLLFVRPLVCIFAQLLGMNPRSVYQLQLFVHNGVKMTKTKIYNHFSSAFLEHSGKPLKFSEYRHVAVHMATKNWRAIIDPQEQMDEYVDFLDKQAGHFTSTSMREYAITVGELDMMRERMLPFFLEASLKWHEIMELSKEPLIGVVEEVAQHFEDEDLIEAQVNKRMLVARKAPVKKVKLAEGRVTVEQSLESLKIIRQLGIQSFRSSAQWTAVDLSNHTTTDLIVILPTGHGKSLLFFSAIVNQPEKAILLIVPLVSLAEDMARRFEEFDGQIQFTVCTKPTQYCNENVIITTPEAIAIDTIYRSLNSIIVQDKISRIFIDEAHFTETDAGYRPDLARLYHVMTLRAPICLLSATMSSDIKQGIQTAYFKKHHPVEIRLSTDRPNLRYSFIKDSSQETLIELVESALEILGTEERIIVYCTSRSTVRELSEKLQSKSYTGDMIDSQRKDSFNAWREGDSKVMVATSAFGAGVDFKSVRFVFLFRLPYSVESFVQQAGRGGRDGSPAYAITLWNPTNELRKLKNMQEESEALAFADMIRLAARESVCTRFELSLRFDLIPVQCIQDSSLEPCQNCWSRRGVPTGTPDFLLARIRIHRLPGLDVSFDEDGFEEIRPPSQVSPAGVAIARSLEAEISTHSRMSPPSQPVSREHTISVIENSIVENESLAASLARKLDILSDCCAECFAVLNVKAPFDHPDCHSFDGHCHVCFGTNHFTRQCAYDALKPTEEDSPTYCIRCYLPPTRLGYSFHQADEFENIMHYDNFLFRFAIVSYHKRRDALYSLLPKAPQEFDSFFVWLFETPSNSDFCNMAHLFDTLVK